MRRCKGSGMNPLFTLFSGTANSDLAGRIAQHLGVALGARAFARCLWVIRPASIHLIGRGLATTPGGIACPATGRSDPPRGGRRFAEQPAVGPTAPDAEETQGNDEAN